MTFRNLFRRRLKENNYLDLTNPDIELPFDVGMKRVRVSMKTKQKVGIGLMIVNFIIPFTFWPITNPIIWRYMVR